MPRKHRIALFGGTFDPIHNGHLLMAEAARESHHLERILFVPAGFPPHKRAPRASARERLRMVRLALRGNPSFGVSDWEIRQNRVVYTYETLEHFRRRYPEASLYFVLGSDALKKLPHWREFRRVKSLCRLAVARRLAPFASTDIRGRIRQGRSIRYLVPQMVERYIKRHQLYQ